MSREVQTCKHLSNIHIENHMQGKNALLQLLSIFTRKI